MNKHYKKLGDIHDTKSQGEKEIFPKICIEIRGHHTGF